MSRPRIAVLIAALLVFCGGFLFDTQALLQLSWLCLRGRCGVGIGWTLPAALLLLVGISVAVVYLRPSPAARKAPARRRNPAKKTKPKSTLKQAGAKSAAPKAAKPAVARKPAARRGPAGPRRTRPPAPQRG